MFIMNPPCPLCKKKASTKHSAQEGYQKPLSFQIHHCVTCQTAFATPLEVHQDIYDRIYNQIEKIPGYNRYLEYSNKILLEKHPLQYLADSEDIYWAIQQVFLQKPKYLKILEVGSGFGYLTYALMKEGFQITGLDISHVAVEQAKKRYGNHFVCANVEDFAKAHEGQYDAVILTEVIEHIPHVHSFIQALHALLKKNGILVLTTPSKTLYPKDILWETEPPPVHLWWFSEASIRYLAKKYQFRVSFVDFTSYNYYSPHPISLKIRNYLPSRLPKLDADGNAIAGSGLASVQPGKQSPPQMTFSAKFLQSSVAFYLKKILSFFHVLGFLKKVFNSNLKRRPTLCAVLVKK